MGSSPPVNIIDKSQYDIASEIFPIFLLVMISYQLTYITLIFGLVVKISKHYYRLSNNTWNYFHLHLINLYR